MARIQKKKKKKARIPVDLLRKYWISYSIGHFYTVRGRLVRGRVKNIISIWLHVEHSRFCHSIN